MRLGLGLGFRFRLRVRVRVQVLSLSDSSRWQASPATPFAACIEVIVRPAVVRDVSVLVESFHLLRLGDYHFGCHVHSELDKVG